MRKLILKILSCEYTRLIIEKKTLHLKNVFSMLDPSYKKFVWILCQRMHTGMIKKWKKNF